MCGIERNRALLFNNVTRYSKCPPVAMKGGVETPATLYCCVSMPAYTQHERLLYMNGGRSD